MDNESAAAGTAMTSFQQEVIRLLTKVQTQQEADHKALFGNGHPGLIEQMAKLSTQMAVLESKLTEQSQQTERFMGLLEDHKLMQASLAELREKAGNLDNLNAKLEALEKDVEVLKAKGAWWKDLAAMIMAGVAMAAQAVAYFMR